MTNIYVLTPIFSKSYTVLGPNKKDSKKREIFEQFHNGFMGKPFGKNWIPLKVYEDCSYCEKGAVLGDCASYRYDVAILSQRAVDVLRDTLERNGEILPFIYKHGNYYAFNVTTVVDVLDKDRSKILYISDTDQIVRIEQPVFIPEKLMGLEIFKLPNLRKSFIYVTDAFVQQVQKANLTGFNFEKVWTQQ